MYAYIDETGNTGKNLFDKNQPAFITAALVTKEDFDLSYQSDVVSISRSVGSAFLHANELGPERVESVSESLLDVLRSSKSKFAISLVDKQFMAVAKLFDTLFDSYENKAVSWTTYNVLPLRLLMLLKMAYIIEEEIVIEFWESLIEADEKLAYEKFIGAIKRLKQNVRLIPDKRSKQIINEAIDWVVQNPEAIYLHIHAKSARAGHLPNMAAFPNLLQGIDRISKESESPVKTIVHDRQNQFQNILKEWHGLFSNASPGEISLFGMDKFSLRCVENSDFVISSSEDSAGIQIIDSILWLFKRFIDRKVIGDKSQILLQYALANAYQYGISLEITEYWLSEYLEDLYSKPLSEEDIARATKLLRDQEERRQRNMAEYSKNKSKNDTE